MRLSYYPETDTLYIALRDDASAESEEVSPGIVVDFDGAGDAVGIEVEHASRRVDLTSLQAFSLPEGALPTPPTSG